MPRGNKGIISYLVYSISYIVKNHKKFRRQKTNLYLVSSIALRNKYIAKKEKEKVASRGRPCVYQQMAIWLIDYIAIIFLLTGKLANRVTG